MNRVIGLLFIAAFVLGMPSENAAQSKKKPPQKKESVRASRQSVAPKKKPPVSRKAPIASDSVFAQRRSKHRTERVASDDDAPVGTTSDGRTVYEGSRIGHYVRDEKGNKVYLKQFSGGHIAGTMPGGETIYRDSYGNHFYYNQNGTKVYVRKP